MVINLTLGRNWYFLAFLLIFFVTFLNPVMVGASEFGKACESLGQGFTEPLIQNSVCKGNYPNEKCGSEGNQIDCGGCSAPYVYHNICCYKTENSITTYGCAPVNVNDFTTAQPDATKVDLNLQGSLGTASKPSKPVYFIPEVGIPGSISIGGINIAFNAGDKIVVTGETIAHYFAVFYRFLVYFLAIAAVTMVSWGGFKRIMAAGSVEKISDANDTIYKAIIGLVLALISYSLLNLINPALVNLQPLQVEEIKKIDFVVGEEQDADITPSGTSPSLQEVQGDNIENSSNAQVDYDAYMALITAAKALKDQGIKLFITSGTRSPAEQKQLIIKNCQNPPGSATCNPKPGRPTTCILKGGDYSCPHTSGKAVDVWAALFDITPISQKQCLKDKIACERDPAMAAMIKVMRDMGFCKLDSEPWHFEKPVASEGRCH